MSCILAGLGGLLVGAVLASAIWAEHLDKKINYFDNKKAEEKYAYAREVEIAANLRWKEKKIEIADKLYKIINELKQEL